LNTDLFYIYFMWANPFKGARALKDGHFDQLTGAFFLFYYYAVATPAVCAAKVSG